MTRGLQICYICYNEIEKHNKGFLFSFPFFIVLFILFYFCFCGWKWNFTSLWLFSKFRKKGDLRNLVLFKHHFSLKFQSSLIVEGILILDPSLEKSDFFMNQLPSPFIAIHKKNKLCQVAPSYPPLNFFLSLLKTFQ